MGHYWGAVDSRKSLDSGTVMGPVPVEGGCQGDGEQDDCAHENNDVSPKIGSGLVGLHIGLPETERLGEGLVPATLKIGERLPAFSGAGMYGRN